MDDIPVSPGVCCVFMSPQDVVEDITGTVTSLINMKKPVCSRRGKDSARMTAHGQLLWAPPPRLYPVSKPTQPPSGLSFCKLSFSDGRIPRPPSRQSISCFSEGMTVSRIWDHFS